MYLVARAELEPVSEGLKPYKFIGFGAMDVTKPYKFIGFGAMEGLCETLLG